MSNYLKGLLTNEEVIQELLKIAHEIAQEDALSTIMKQCDMWSENS